MRKRIDLHTHSLLSDGELLPSELARRACVLGHEAIAITDHIDASNINTITSLIDAVEDIGDNWDIRVIPGAEITHAPVEIIEKLAVRARGLGAEIIVVHGETIVEPVIPGTNHAAVSCPEVDILAHPGLITVDDAELARENGVTLELSARKGHCLGNGHVAGVAREVGVPVVIDTDTHAPGDLLDYDTARRVGLGAGLNESEVEDALVKNPRKLLKGNGII
ncbi:MULTISPECIES: histidinol phosphate phosphatase domain-containing protein [unclassified Methanothermobacter]|uniref:histidinol phosphate phosphatase domain-containing protein n=1 Tax=unclassified Methanothermobacter TaxID=2631116 RepID=UPI0011CCAE0F|nr:MULTISPECIES: histidinol phosphate phosphatase domain-containing protein [unclassified Methanothermobacter]QEF95215.1 histidinol phosphate phosphatase domain-containing protein [Methanothermobacter sp. KEPCO-1]QHN08140.1 histidinol phosphate phosphatase domain-containing protein [Methanothermobacter sp. THM-2]